MSSIFDSIDSLKLTPQLSSAISKIVSGSRIVDLLLYAPYDYDVIFSTNVNKIKNGDKIIIPLVIDSISSISIKSFKKKVPTKIQCHYKNNEAISVTLVFFQINPHFLAKFQPDMEITCMGVASITKSSHIDIAHPKIIKQNEHIKDVSIIQRVSDIDESDCNDHPLQIRPVYRLSHDIPSWQFNAIMMRAIKIAQNYKFSEWHEYENYPRFYDSIAVVHLPKSISDISDSALYLKRLAHDELLAFQVAINLNRSKRKSISGVSIVNQKRTILETVKSNLKFSLTDDQENAISDIISDQENSKRMFRLLQGDVGCGKTIVAMLAMINAVESGFKAVLLAPTTSLAKQHFETLKTVCKNTNIVSELLLGGQSGSLKKSIVAKIELGMIDILIGTHALLQDKVSFKNVGLVVIDEQHSFGVKQRASLMSKCENADILMMTATPIPRTLTMAIYGDVSVSVIKSKPSNRQKIYTSIIGMDKYDSLILSIKNQINNGAKAYWVCPLVEDSEEIELTSAEARFGELKDIFRNLVGVVHGKMKQDARDAIMLKFKTGEIKLLVATTVIEVGIDVPDATIIVIEHAERFGLSQIHQLRGRVGRGDLKSYCILLYDGHLSHNAKRRLAILKNSDDGFRIAEEDLKIRGSGDLLGTDQSGFNIFKFVSMSRDADIIKDASLSAKKIISSNLMEEEKYKVLLEIFNFHNLSGFGES